MVAITRARKKKNRVYEIVVKGRDRANASIDPKSDSASEQPAKKRSRAQHGDVMVADTAMDPERWRRALDVFKSAMAHDAGERTAFVAGACRGDAGIREAVEQLLAGTERFLFEPWAREVWHRLSGT